MSVYLAQHPGLRMLLWVLAIGASGLWFNWATWKRTPEEWALYQVAYPRRALLIRFTRAALPHARKLAQIFTVLKMFLPASLRPPATEETKNAPLPPEVTLAIAEALSLAKRAHQIADEMQRYQREAMTLPGTSRPLPEEGGAPPADVPDHPVAMVTSGVKSIEVVDVPKKDEDPSS